MIVAGPLLLLELTLKAETFLLGLNLLHLLEVQIKKASYVTFLVTVQVLPDKGLDERVQAHAGVPQPGVVGSMREQMSDPRDQA